MKKPLIGLLASVLVAGATVLTGVAPAQAAPTQAISRTTSAHAAKATQAGQATRAAKALDAVDFSGTVALSDCSGSLVRMPGSVGSDPGLVLTNGHCLETGMPGPGQVIVDQPSSRTFTLLDGSANEVGTLNATKVVYSAMTGTDVTIYQLDSSYDTIQAQTGISPLTVSADHPVQGTDIRVVSGYWKQIYSCSVDGFAYQLKEGSWTWNDSVRYTSGCKVIGGTSGSPVVDANTGQVVAVNNTTNENGESCTVNNPCEVDQSGAVTIHQGIGYAQETYIIPACFSAGNTLDLTLSGCTLARP
ncbi:serine protease [Kitasatospora sp. NPDC058162]|uniref:S1 family peptidase n=1 Tax=Kitasatospora sp. NPDC058162 TaxID=3346362 RepID=UPI0036DDB653